MKWRAAVLVSFVAVAAFWAGYESARWHKPSQATPKPQAGRPATRYYCPMHPSYTSDRPGDCPICGMRLVPMEQWPPEGGRRATEKQHLPPGVFHVPVERQQLIGVRYGTVEWSSADRVVRAVGRVQVDETRVVRVHPKVDGWLEEVYVDFVGKFVRQGQPLASLYSPQLLVAQQEYLLALKAQQLLSRPNSLTRGLEAGSVGPERAEMARSLVAAARRRLELSDVSPEEVQLLEQTGKPSRTVKLYAPISGYVLARNAYPQQRVTPETELYMLADLSRVWVIVDVYEYEAPLIRLGLPAIVRLPYEPSRQFRSQVSYIQPSLDPSTRTLKVRLEVENTGLALKPEMFVHAELHVPQPRRLTVPVEAVLDSGLVKTVFVDHGNGYLERRRVETGEIIGDRIVILKGLNPGERIVVSGTFLIDSESRLQTAMRSPAGAEHIGHSQGVPSGQASAPPEAHGHD